MKPAKFDYYRPDSIKEALELLEEAGDEGKILAGGQSLVPTMNMRLAQPACLIDINNLRDLEYISNDTDNVLNIGAMTRQSTIEKSSVVAESCGLLHETMPSIGHVQTRNRGTIGGSIIHADPSAELPLTLLTMDGTVKISSMEEERIVSAEDLFVTYLTTDIMPTELLTEIHFPVMQGRNGSSFQEFMRRHGDFALVSASSHITIDDSNRISNVRLGLGGVDAVPLLIEEANEIMKEEKLSESLLDKVVECVELEIDPETDLHASAEYRTHLVKVLTRRSIVTAYQKAKESSNGKTAN